MENSCMEFLEFSMSQVLEDPQRCGDRVRSEVIAGSTVELCDHQRSGGRFHGGVVWSCGRAVAWPKWFC